MQGNVWWVETRIRLEVGRNVAENKQGELAHGINCADWAEVWGKAQRNLSAVCSRGLRARNKASSAVRKGLKSWNRTRLGWWGSLNSRESSKFGHCNSRTIIWEAWVSQDRITIFRSWSKWYSEAINDWAHVKTALETRSCGFSKG